MIGFFVEVYEKYMVEGYEIFFIYLIEKLSGIVNVVC